MSRFWSTLAIVNAVWAATGEVDIGSVIQALLVGWCLVMLMRAEKRELTSARRSPRTSA